MLAWSVATQTILNAMSNVSVIIPCYNSARSIMRALESVRKQTAPPLEIIVVDDASTDDTVKVIEQWQADTNAIALRLIKSPVNRGAAVARNTGWNHARADFIAFLDSDDSWHPEKLALQSAWLLANPDVKICGHAYEVLETVTDSENADSKTSHARTFHNVQYFQFEDFLIRNRLSTPTVMLRRDLDERFAQTKRYCEDYDLWLRISHNHGPCACSDARLTYLYKQAWGVSGLSADLWPMYRAEIECYKQCHANGWIGKPKLLALGFLSLFKHVRRVLKKHAG